MRRFFVFAFVALVLAGLVGGLSYFQFVFKPVMLHNIISKMVPPPTTVSAETARTEVWAKRFEGIGSFTAEQGINIAAQVGGIVERVDFKSGADVSKGALLIKIDDSVEQADLKSDLAALKNAALNLSRQQQLAQTGNGAKANLDAAVAARDQAAALVDKVRATIAQKTITAPFSGRLGLRAVNVGQYVSPGLNLGTLTRLDPIFVDFPVPEQDITKVTQGKTVTISADAYPGRKFKGLIAATDARIDTATRNVTVRAKVDNPGHLLLPGMFAKVSFDEGAPASVITVPRTAVTFSLYGNSVYVIIPVPSTGATAADKSHDLTIQQVFVQTGAINGDRIAISQGLKAGARVVTQGQIKLIPHARVVVAAGDALKAPPVMSKE